MALVVTSEFPYPPDGGDKLSAYVYVRSLKSLGYCTDVLCFLSRGDSCNPKGYVRNVYAVQKPPKLRVLSLACSLLLGRSYLFERFKLTRQGTRQVREINGFGPYDVIIVLHPYLMSLVDASSERCSRKIVISAQVVESSAFRRKAALEHRFLRCILKREAAIAEREEVATFGRVHRTLFYSPDEAKWYRLHGGTNGSYIPFGLDLDQYVVCPRQRHTRSRIVFYGTFSWHPNSDALRYLLSEVWPTVRLKSSDVELVIAGKEIPEWAQRYVGGNVSILGEVPSIAKFVSSSDIVIVPVRIGGGTRVKTLEAMALGRPVISTTASLEGNDAIPGEEVLVADTPEQFAEQINAILSSGELWDRIAIGGRKYVEVHHDYRRVTVEALMNAVG